MLNKVRLLVSTLVLLLPAAGWGECRCLQPPAPELPPNRPTQIEMAQTGKEVSAFAEAMKGYRECLVKCMRAAEGELNHVVNEWNEMVEKFNQQRGEK